MFWNWIFFIKIFKPTKSEFSRKNCFDGYNFRGEIVKNPSSEIFQKFQKFVSQTHSTKWKVFFQNLTHANFKNLSFIEKHLKLAIFELFLNFRKTHVLKIFKTCFKINNQVVLKSCESFEKIRSVDFEKIARFLRDVNFLFSLYRVKIRS